MNNHAGSTLTRPVGKHFHILTLDKVVPGGGYPRPYNKGLICSLHDLIMSLTGYNNTALITHPVFYFLVIITRSRLTQILACVTKNICPISSLLVG